VIADATDPIANTITNYVNAILQNRAQEINKATCQPIKYKPKPIVLSILGIFYLLPGVMTVILMLVSAMMTSISITREKNWVPWKYCSSPLNPLSYSGKSIPYIFLSIINATVIVVLGVLFRNAHRGSIFYSLESILFIITALSLGMINYF
jgi:ABC-2 type transport system permease protein